jgi:hypothetical protein
MDRRKIYYTTIVVCIIASAGILYWNSRNDSVIVPPEHFSPINTGDLDSVGTQQSRPTQSSSNIPTPEAVTTFPVPRVFPNDGKLDLTVFNSNSYTSLTDYTPLTVSPSEIGRDNPYQPY